MTDSKFVAITHRYVNTENIVFMLIDQSTLKGLCNFNDKLSTTWSLYGAIALMPSKDYEPHEKKHQNWLSCTSDRDSSMVQLEGCWRLKWRPQTSQKPTGESVAYSGHLLPTNRSRLCSYEQLLPCGKSSIA